MHISANYLSVTEAIAWADDAYPPSVRGNLYSDSNEKLAEEVDFLFTSRTVCNHNGTKLRIVGVSIDHGQPHSLYNTSQAIVWLMVHE